MKVHREKVCTACISYSKTHFVDGNIKLDDAPLVDVPMHDAPVANAPVIDAPLVDDPVVDAPEVDMVVLDAPEGSVPVVDPAPAPEGGVPVVDPAPVTLEQKIDDIIQSLSSLTWDALNDSEKSSLVRLGGALGGFVTNDIYYNDRDNISQKYSEYSYLTTLDEKEWINERNVVVRSFVEGATGVIPERDSKRKVRNFVSVLEEVYHLRDLNLITPFAFRRNVVIYSVTNSKLATQIMASSSGSGSYTTMHNFITTPREPLACPPVINVHNVIDNNQKVSHHSGCIREGSSVPMSICTARQFLIYCHLLLLICSSRHSSSHCIG